MVDTETKDVIQDIDWEMSKRDFKFFFEEILGWQLADHHAKWFHNLNTHNIASPYKTFEPAEARRIARRLEFHYTPKHGSWINMAEIELRVFARQLSLPSRPR